MPGGVGHRPLEDRAGAPFVRGPVRGDDVAEKPDDPPGRRPPGKGGDGAGVRLQVKGGGGVLKPFHRRLFKGNSFGKGTLQLPRHDADVFRDAEEVAEGETDEFDVVFLDKGKHFRNGVVHRLLSRSFLWRRHGAGHTLYLFYHISRPSGKGYFPTLRRRAIFVIFTQNCPLKPPVCLRRPVGRWS